MGRTRFIAAYQTEAGRAAQNQDACAVFDVTLPDGRSGPHRTIKVVIVADGINGHQGGDVASTTTVETIESSFQEIDAPILEAMQSAIQRANKIIFDKALEDPKLRGMGCTVVMAVLDTTQLYLAHVGDSRAYLVRRGKIHRLTEDHVREARGASSAPQLARRLGRTAKVNVDFAYIPPNTSAAQAETRVGSLPLQRGDSILLCTDGLTDTISDDLLQGIVAEAWSPKIAAQRLIATAKRAGASDDRTAVVARWPRWSGHAILFWLSLLLIGLLWLGSEMIPTMAKSFCSGNNELSKTLSVLSQLPICSGTPTATSTSTSPTETPMAVTLPSTSAPISTPTPANTEVTPPATATDQPTVAPVPTNTPTPARTATPKPTLIEISTATATPRPTATYTSTPDVTATPTSLPATPSTAVEPLVTDTLTPLPGETLAGQISDAQDICYEDVTAVVITLQQPADGATSPDDQVFAWTVNCRLGLNQAFEPIFWKPGEKPIGQGRGLVGTTSATSVTIGPDDANLVGVGNTNLLWSVRIVQIPYNARVYPYEAVEAAVHHYTFINSGGSSSNSPASAATSTPTPPIS